MNSQERIGLVLSGGGAAGLAHIGVLKALEENGRKMDEVYPVDTGIRDLNSCGF